MQRMSTYLSCRDLWHAERFGFRYRYAVLNVTEPGEVFKIAIYISTLKNVLLDVISWLKRAHFYFWDARKLFLAPGRTSRLAWGWANVTNR